MTLITFLLICIFGMLLDCWLSRSRGSRDSWRLQSGRRSGRGVASESERHRDPRGGAARDDLVRRFFLTALTASCLLLCIVAS